MIRTSFDIIKHPRNKTYEVEFVIFKGSRCLTYLSPVLKDIISVEKWIGFELEKLERGEYDEFIKG